MNLNSEAGSLTVKTICPLCEDTTSSSRSLSFFSFQPTLEVCIGSRPLETFMHPSQYPTSSLCRNLGDRQVRGLRSQPLWECRVLKGNQGSHRPPLPSHCVLDRGNRSHNGLCPHKGCAVLEDVVAVPALHCALEEDISGLYVPAKETVVRVSSTP